jgi:hypothetical protein
MPLVYVKATLGTPFYEESPKEFSGKQKPTILNNIKVYYWGKDAKKQFSTAVHAVSVIEAQEVDGKGYVYYKDPNAMDKIFLTSFDNFKNNILCMSGKSIDIDESQMPEISDSSNGCGIGRQVSGSASPYMQPQLVKNKSVLVAYSTHNTQGMAALLKDDIKRSIDKPRV